MAATKKQVKLEKKFQISTIMELDISWLTKKNTFFLSIFYLLSSHKAQRKEHMQKRKHVLLCFCFVEIA